MEVVLVELTNLDVEVRVDKDQDEVYVGGSGGFVPGSKPGGGVLFDGKVGGS